MLKSPIRRAYAEVTYMDEKQLIAAIAAKTHDQKVVIRRILHAFEEVVAQAMLDGDEVRLRDFGRFYPRWKRRTDGYDCARAIDSVWEARNDIMFKSFRALRRGAQPNKRAEVVDE